MKEKAAKKQSFLNRKRAEWKEMKLWNGNELCKVDWIVSILILTVLFFTCVHSDVKLTGNRSFLMYKHFSDFYQASYEQSGGYWANYLPSTFIAYAIWNLPLYLTGHAPEAILTNSFVNLMWYKLLPVIVYFITAQLIYHIGKEMGFGEKKSLLCKFAFLVFPMGVFSQFIFSQYDIFTVFFMVLGLYFFLKNRMWQFALAFGMACTFKYHAALYFLALLLLKEKKIRNLIKYAVAMALPLMIEVLPNIGNIYFKRNVLGFGVLKFVQKPFTIGFFDGINLVAVVAAFMLVWAYQKKAKDNRELFSWGIFLCVGMSFAIFGFSSWNPQWLLMLVPFLVLNIFMNENGNLLVMVTNVLIVALYIFCSQNLVDEQVMNYGILKYILPGQQFAVRMWDLYMFHDEKMLCSAMWVVLLVYVVFGHPKYHIRKGTEIAKGLVWQIRAAFLISVFAFVIPASICALGMFQGKIVFLDNSRQDLEPDNIIQVDESSSVSQDLTMEGSVLSNLKIRVYTGEKSISDTLTVEMIDKETGTVVYQGEKETDSFTTNSALYSFIGEKVPVEKGKTYELRISSEAEAGSGIGLYCVTADSEAQLLKQTEAREELPASRLQMRVTGEQ